MSDNTESTAAPTLAGAPPASTKGQAKSTQSKNDIAWTETRKFTLVKIVVSIRGHLKDKRPKKERRGETKGKRFVKVTQEETWEKIHASGASQIDLAGTCIAYVSPCSMKAQFQRCLDEVAKKSWRKRWSRQPH